MDKNTRDIIDSLNFIREHMLSKEEGVTKSELAALKSEFTERIEQLSEKIEDTRIELRGKFESLDKRLDIEVIKRTEQRLPERMRAIEQHLGIEKQIAA